MPLWTCDGPRKTVLDLWIQRAFLVRLHPEGGTEGEGGESGNQGGKDFEA